MPPEELARRLTDTAIGLLGEAKRMGWRGPDAYDGLWWGWPGPLVAGVRRRQALIQLHARSPFDVRKLYRRRHPLIPKALGVFGSVGMRAASLTGDEGPAELALEALELLDRDVSAGPEAWGYPFDMQTRWSFNPAANPNVVATAFGASGLLESGRPDLCARAVRAARWVLDTLWVEPDGYFAYHPGRPANVYNANLLAAWLVHVALPGEPLARERVARVVSGALAAQQPDGSWPYGAEQNLSWVDSFHTGYVLTCLARLADVDAAVPEAVARGARYYERFFDADGRAQLWADRAYPEDAHAAGTGMTTLAALVRAGAGDRELLERVARRTVEYNIKDGHAVYRRYRWGATTVKYLRWADAHVALGLVDAAAVLAGSPDPVPRPQPVDS